MSVGFRSLSLIAMPLLVGTMVLWLGGSALGQEQESDESVAEESHEDDAAHSEDHGEAEEDGEGHADDDHADAAHEDAAHDDAAHGEDDHGGAGAHGDAHGGGHGDPNPLAVDLDLAIWTGVVFVVLFAVLAKFAWPPIVAALEERENRIADNIASAAAKHEEAKQLLAAHEAKLATAADEVRELLEEARRDAEHTKSQIVADAKKAAEEEMKRAVREVELAKDSALHELAERSANTAIDLAGQVVREQLNPTRQAEIVREALGNLAGSNNN